MTRLIQPDRAALPRYAAALERGWSPDTRRQLAATEHLAAIAADADAFIASLDDREARGAPITVPDGSSVPRLPGYYRWIMTGDDFAGSIGLRWQPGTAALPDWVPGHIGYSVVPWHQRQGHAIAALALLLPEARALGLAHVDLVAEADNFPSQQVITANHGILVARFAKPGAHGGADTLRFRIMLGEHNPGQALIQNRLSRCPEIPDRCADDIDRGG